MSQGMPFSIFRNAEHVSFCGDELLLRACQYQLLIESEELCLGDQDDELDHFCYLEKL